MTRHSKLLLKNNIEKVIRYCHCDVVIKDCVVYLTSIFSLLCSWIVLFDESQEYAGEAHIAKNYGCTPANFT